MKMTEITLEECTADHKRRHKILHGQLDELISDWVGCTSSLPSKSTVLELMRWSAKQIESPDKPRQ